MCLAITSQIWKKESNIDTVMHQNKKLHSTAKSYFRVTVGYGWHGLLASQVHKHLQNSKFAACRFKSRTSADSRTRFLSQECHDSWQWFLRDMEICNLWTLISYGSVHQLCQLCLARLRKVIFCTNYRCIGHILLVLLQFVFLMRHLWTRSWAELLAALF